MGLVWSNLELGVDPSGIMNVIFFYFNYFKITLQTCSKGSSNDTSNRTSNINNNHSSNVSSNGSNSRARFCIWVGL